MDLTLMTFASFLLEGLTVALMGAAWTRQKIRPHHTDWTTRPRTFLNLYAQHREEAARRVAVPLLIAGLIVVVISAIGLIVATILR